jgi:hypothetical protein
MMSISNKDELPCIRSCAATDDVISLTPMHVSPSHLHLCLFTPYALGIHVARTGSMNATVVFKASIALAGFHILPRQRECWWWCEAAI